MGTGTKNPTAKDGKKLNRIKVFSLLFRDHTHPFTGALTQRLVEGSIAGLQAADTEVTGTKLPDGRPRPALYDDSFAATYQPGDVVDTPWPVGELDFSPGGAYAVYNWELFFHIPLTIALHLSKGQRFEEAQRWLHLIFDPTDSSDGPTPERFWRFQPFQHLAKTRLETLLKNLSEDSNNQAARALREQTLASIRRWQRHPFRPHRVAQLRPEAYRLKALMAYLDNLIAWGDALFAQDTRETIQEAAQLYVLAANILGRRPEQLPAQKPRRARSYKELRSDLDAFSNALRDAETALPFDLAPAAQQPAAPKDATSDALDAIESAGRALYFCLPPNDRLLRYWDAVADRLFKIRNSLNLQGVFRQLPLFEPPIDPALLARAAAAGVDIARVLAGASQPLPLVRFPVLLQKALELCGEVRSLGNNLLSSMEKEDNEELAILRARHERTMLGLAETVRYGQWQEAIRQREGLEIALANAVERRRWFERLLGAPAESVKAPELEPIEAGALQRHALQTREPVQPRREVAVAIAPPGAAAILGVHDEGRQLSLHEVRELGLMKQAQDTQTQAVALDALAAMLNLIPMYSADGKPFGVGAGVAFGGRNLASMLAIMASVSRGQAGRFSYEATLAARMGAYARREQEWAHQSNVIAGEIDQLTRQLRAAQLREAIAHQEWKNHQQQVRHAEEIDHFLNDPASRKNAQKALYTWMKREVQGLHGQCLQLAVELARKAERALRHELGDPALSFIQPATSTGREALLAGDRLYLDLKRMELAWIELNQREYELTRHVSLLQLDPAALLQLRATGRCSFTLPEGLFDLDTPGHYFRRLRSVAVTLPAVAGPWTNVHCKLTLTRSSIRHTPEPGADYARKADDPRFSEHAGHLDAIVTSTGQSDAGLFESNLHGERLLPFEGAGAISTWQLELPHELRTFDYDTLTDLILTLRYTAREGGARLQLAATASLKKQLKDAAAAGSSRLLSARHELPTAWARLRSAGALTLTLIKDHLPFWARDLDPRIKTLRLYAAATTRTSLAITTPDGSPLATLTPDPDTTLLRGELSPPPTLGAPLTLALDPDGLDDLWLEIVWSAG